MAVPFRTVSFKEIIFDLSTKVFLVVCSFLGSVYGYSQVDNYDSLLVVLKELSDTDKQELVRKIQVRLSFLLKLSIGISG